MNLPEYNNLEAGLFEQQMSNWSYLALILPDLKDEATLLKMIKFEIDHQSRVYIIDRLKGRFNRMRDNRERLELLKNV